MKTSRVLIPLFGLLVSACGSKLPGLPGSGGGTPGGFHVQGVASATTAFAAGDKTITHVVAVNPSSQDPRRVVATVASDGAFSLDLDPSRPWVLVFVDSTRVGADMIAGILSAQTLDSLAPAGDGSADLGTISFAGSDATASITYEQLIADLGLDPATAEYLGSIDDLCLRYVNPDIDADGVMDVNQQRDLRLDFHVRMQMFVGTTGATIASVTGSFLDPATTWMQYTGTGIYASFPSSFYGGDLHSTGWVSFDDTAHLMTFSTSGSMAATIPPGTQITGSQLNVGAYGDYQSFGIDAPPGFDMPQGSYRFGAGPTTLTFTNVKTRTDAELVAGANFIMPFVRFVPVDSSCTSACALSAIDYEWMRRTPDGWTAATTQEVSLVVGDLGGFASLYRTYDNSTQRMMWTIPATSSAGTLSWSQPSHLENMSDADLAATTSDMLCHFGLSYDDKLGMRIFSGIQNAPGTCPMQ